MYVVLLFVFVVDCCWFVVWYVCVGLCCCFGCKIGGKGGCFGVVVVEGYWFW